MINQKRSGARPFEGARAGNLGCATHGFDLADGETYGLGHHSQIFEAHLCLPD